MNCAYLIARSLPLEQDNDATPKMLALIVLDDDYLRGLDVVRHLENLGHKLGLLDFEVVIANAGYIPVKQLTLPFPQRRRR